MIRKVLFITLILVIAIVASGCSSTPTTTPNPTPAPATTPMPVPQNQQAYTVNIQNNAFNPSSLQVPAGSTVKWVNLDSVQHEPKGNVFDSGPLNQNGVFEHTFNQAGTYNYACAIHPSMQGTITVV
ncbi:MAG: cupredoxin domain-containing protein [Methanosarcina sp.]